ncbi:MAG: hypothetical protein AAGB15_07315 [Pseudomonadota bacterium]
MSQDVQPSRLSEILEDLVALRRATREADVPVGRTERETETA